MILLIKTLVSDDTFIIVISVIVLHETMIRSFQLLSLSSLNNLLFYLSQPCKKLQKSENESNSELFWLQRFFFPSFLFSPFCLRCEVSRYSSLLNTSKLIVFFLTTSMASARQDLLVIFCHILPISGLPLFGTLERLSSSL